jgi:hypothetical protein
MLIRCLAVLAAAAMVASSPASAAPKPLFQLSDPRLAEISGLAVGHRSPSVLYLQNDSGDSARFFALDARTGVVRAECRVPGASNVDWEDLATGPDSAGTPSVWLADVGDNDAVRDEVDIYRVDEPIIGAAMEFTTSAPQRWRLRYPDGPHDAESLVLDPVRHRLYVVTKALLGQSEVFAVPDAPDPARVQPMVQVASVRFGFTGTPGGPNAIGQLTATGASMSADGSVLAIRTYTDAYLWPVPRSGVAAALRSSPVRVALPAQPQGEGIAIDGHSLLIDSEQAGSAVYSVPIPGSVFAAASDASKSAASGSAAPNSAAPSSAASTSAEGSVQGRSGWLGWPVGALGTGLAALMLAGAAAAVRRHRSMDRAGR